MKMIKALIVSAVFALTAGVASAGGLCAKIHDTDWHGYAAAPRPFTEGEIYATDTDFYVFNASDKPETVDVIFTDNNGRKHEESIKLSSFNWKRFRGVSLEIEQTVLRYRHKVCAASLKNRQTNFSDQTLKTGGLFLGAGALFGGAICLAVCGPAAPMMLLPILVI